MITGKIRWDVDGHNAYHVAGYYLTERCQCGGRQELTTYSTVMGTNEMHYRVENARVECVKCHAKGVVGTVHIPRKDPVHVPRNTFLGPREGACITCSTYMSGGCADGHDPGWPECKYKIPEISELEGLT